MRREVAEELVRGWRADENFYRAVARGMLAAGEIVPYGGYKYLLKEVGIAYLIGSTCKRALGAHFRIVSDALWDGCSDAHAVQLLVTTAPSEKRSTAPCPSTTLRRVKTQRLIFSVRDRDTTNSWGTVKATGPGKHRHRVK